MTTVPHVDSGTPHEKIMRELREYGAVIVEGFLDDDTLARFNAELDPLLGGHEPQDVPS